MSLLLLGRDVHPSTMGSRCVVSFGDNVGFSPTVRSHRERHTLACCCENFESRDRAFRMSAVVLLGEKYKCHQNRQNISYNPWALMNRDLRGSGNYVYFLADNFSSKEIIGIMYLPRL